MLIKMSKKVISSAWIHLVSVLYWKPSLMFVDSQLCKALLFPAVRFTFLTALASHSHSGPFRLRFLGTKSEVSCIQTPLTWKSSGVPAAAAALACCVGLFFFFSEHRNTYKPYHGLSLPSFPLPDVV